ncbi:MAG: AAA family ATPase [Holophagales bacterium]|nr:AAA family ATPase [Holophagales bacterium]MYF95101.1 AAA family ATPase [Holophagales bacterium]
MSAQGSIQRVRVRGFRSLADVELTDLPGAAVLIGANGAGKSNFIRFFEMLSWMLKARRLDEFVQKHGGADDQLYGGNRTTPRMEAELSLRTGAGRNDYRFALSYAHPDRLFFTEERFRFNREDQPTEAYWQYLEAGHREADIVKAAQAGVASGVNPTTAWVIVRLLQDCAVYQFHDTSDESNFKKKWDANDNNYLRSHGGNLSAVLLRLEREDLDRYELICEQIGRILPGFDRFELDESSGKVLLRWKAKGADKTFGAHLTSDGSLRFFALVTLLNLPDEMLPNVLLLDEPELGLHPAAITLVGGMIRSLAEERQVIVATQSPLLVDAFDLEEIFVLEMRDGRTEVQKLSSDDYRVWLDEDFTPGELWQKNLLGGRP